MTTARYGGRLSALRIGRLYPQEYSWYSFSLRAEGNMSLKNPVTTPGIDPGTVRLVAQLPQAPVYGITETNVLNVQATPSSRAVLELFVLDYTVIN